MDNVFPLTNKIHVKYIANSILGCYMTKHTACS